MRIVAVVRIALAITLTVALTLIAPTERAHVALAAECTPRIGPSIAPPANPPSGIPGLHAYWYGQSGYPTLCPGETSVATVAFYNSGSQGWYYGVFGSDYTALSLGTSGPEPGQDQASVLGGTWMNGSPKTDWSDFNRPAIQPAQWVGPGQVAWFQFTVKAPPTPGTYRLYMRPLIETVQWLEDFGVYWQVTVVPTTTTPRRVIVETVDPAGDVFTASGTHYLYDRNDGFEYGDATISYGDFERALTPGDVIDVRYEPSTPERSMFVMVEDPPYFAPIIQAQIGNFDHGTTNNDVRLIATPPHGEPVAGAGTRASVPAGTTQCWAGSGTYALNTTMDASGDKNVPSGTYCYRVYNGMFGYSPPVTIANPPTPAAPEPAPRSIDARVTSSSGGAMATFDFGDRLVAAFDQVMGTCAGNTVVRLRDADGTVADLSTSSRNIGCERNEAPQDVGGTTYPAFRVLTLTLVAAPTIIEQGTTAGLQLPATVMTATGITSDGGMSWDVSGSADVLFGDPD